MRRKVIKVHETTNENKTLINTKSAEKREFQRKTQQLLSGRRLSQNYYSTAIDLATTHFAK